MRGLQAASPTCSVFIKFCFFKCPAFKSPRVGPATAERHGTAAAPLGSEGLLTLEMAASLCRTPANKLVDVLPCCVSWCSRCSRAASCELPVSSVAVNRTSRIISEAEQL